jgi:formylmethanofuran dehydrogenase subunit C
VTLNFYHYQKLSKITPEIIVIEKKIVIQLSSQIEMVITFFGTRGHTLKDHFKTNLRSEQDHRLKIDLKSDQDHVFF